MKKFFMFNFCVLVFVSFIFSVGYSYAQATWEVPGDFSTIQAAVDNVNPGDTILVMGPGPWRGAIVDKQLTIKGENGAVINDGPNSHSFLRAGFLFPADWSGSGTTISHFKFECVCQFSYIDDGYIDFPIFSRGADNVTVQHCVFINSLQGISNWGGSGWNIHHNDFIDLCTLNGGGIGVLIGDRFATPGGVNDNVVSHNKIYGTLRVYPGDGGQYYGSGIVIYADFRYVWPGAEEMTGNKIVNNSVSLISDTPAVVDIVAIELSQAWWPLPPPDPEPIVVYGNKVGFNDLRGTALQIVLTPAVLDNPTNNISRNLGNNRGQGLHPQILFN